MQMSEAWRWVGDDGCHCWVVRRFSGEQAGGWCLSPSEANAAINHASRDPMVVIHLRKPATDPTRH